MNKKSPPKKKSPPRKKKAVAEKKAAAESENAAVPEATSEPRDPRQSKDPEVLGLLAVNDGFYESVSTGDLQAMQALWIHAEDAMCIHPSGLILREWEDIERAWRAVFRNGPPRIITESERVTVRDDVGVVFCVERIISEAGMGLAAATNVYQKADGDWRMFWHQSSLLPSVM